MGSAAENIGKALDKYEAAHQQDKSDYQQAMSEADGIGDVIEAALDFAKDNAQNVSELVKDLGTALTGGDVNDDGGF